jgi:hypothetical protein
MMEDLSPKAFTHQNKFACTHRADPLRSSSFQRAAEIFVRNNDCISPPARPLTPLVPSGNQK